MLEPVLGTELLRLAKLPTKPFENNKTMFTEGWVQHPSLPMLAAYADTRPESLTQYFRVGEAIYKMDGLTYWLAPEPVLLEIKKMIESLVLQD